MIGVSVSRSCCTVVRVLSVISPAVAVAFLAGCSLFEGSGYGSIQSRSVQVQFYAPEGAKVVVRGRLQADAEIRSRGPLGDRLEHEVEECAVFELMPGTYEFAYLGGAGVEDSAIYGELEIRRPARKTTQRFVAHSFVPIRLTSAARQEAEHLLPSRDLSYTVGLEDREFAHLKQGDVIDQVYFVADLEKVKREYEVEYYQAINDVDRELAVLADREEYLTVRYDEAREKALFRDPAMNIEDKIAHERFDLLGIEEPFIRLSKKLQAARRQRETLLLERQELEDERARRNALLRSMKIVHRAGALVLATPDLTIPFRDSVEQASELGEVLAVVRVGGRHHYWAWNSHREEATEPPVETSDSHAHHADEGSGAEP